MAEVGSEPRQSDSGTCVLPTKLYCLPHKIANSGYLWGGSGLGEAKRVSNFSANSNHPSIIQLITKMYIYIFHKDIRTTVEGTRVQTRKQHLWQMMKKQGWLPPRPSLEQFPWLRQVQPDRCVCLAPGRQALQVLAAAAKQRSEHPRNPQVLAQMVPAWPQFPVSAGQ